MISNFDEAVTVAETPQSINEYSTIGDRAEEIPSIIVGESGGPPPNNFDTNFHKTDPEVMLAHSSPSLVHAEDVARPIDDVQGKSPTLLEDFFGSDDWSEPEAERVSSPSESPPQPSPTITPLRDFLLEEVADELAHFYGYESLKAIFWRLLGYERVDVPLAVETFSPEVRRFISSVSVFAQHDGIRLLALQCQHGSFSRRLRRILLEQVTQRFSTVAVLFGNFAWSRVVLGFIGGIDENANPSFLRLSPVTDSGELARLIGLLRTFQENQSPRTGLELIGSFQSLFLYLDQTEADEIEEPFLDPVRLHNRDVWRIPTLSQEKSQEYLRSIACMGPVTQVGNKLVRVIPENRRMEYRKLHKCLLEGHLRLCHHVIHHFSLHRHRRSMNWSDLMQEAVFGLARAIDLYDSMRGYKFSTYACHWIRQAIQRAIHNNDQLIRIPCHYMEAVAGIPSYEWRRLTRILSLSANQFGVAHEVVDTHVVNPSEPLSCHESLEKQRATLEKCLQTLTARSRRILQLRFGLEDGNCWTLEEVGQLFSLSRERIRQIEMKALEKLSKCKRLDILEEEC